jgi:hypothetical protein
MREADHSRKHKQGGRAGTIALIAQCDQAAQVSLAGSLTELLGEKSKHGKSKHGKQRIHTFRLGPITASVGAGVPRTLTLELPRAALSGLANKAKESVALTLTGTNANGTSGVSAQIHTLKAA